MRSAALLLAAATTALPTLALAQDVPAPAPEAAVESASLDPAQLEDPNVDRGMLLPTAQTQPKGTFAFNDYELFLMGLSYGVTDDLQLTATTLVPITTDMPLFLLTSAKYRAVQSGKLRVSLIGSLGIFNDDPVFDDGDSDTVDEDVTVFSLTGGAAATICLTDDCHSTANATVTFSKGFADGESSDGVGVIYGGSLIARTSKHTKLVVEVASGAGMADGDVENIDGALVNYGVRFFSGNIAGDVGFIRPVGGDSEDGDGFLFGLPFVTFTYRN
jgi:hypothetical protein